MRPDLERSSGGEIALRAEGPPAPAPAPTPYAVASLTISSRHFRGQMFWFM